MKFKVVFCNSKTIEIENKKKGWVIPLATIVEEHNLTDDWMRTGGMPTIKTV